MNRVTPVLALFAVIMLATATSSCTAQSSADLEDEVAALKEEVALLRKELDEVLALAPIQSLIVENRPINVSMSLEDIPTMGDPDAKLTIVEFSDFQCPYCARHVTNTYPSLKEEYVETGKMQYAFFDFPLGNHPLAPKASEAAHCASEQNKFWEMHDVLFENQKQLQPASLKAHAATAGVEDMAAFNECLDSGRYAELVQANMAEGSKLRVRGTPTFGVGYTTDDGESVYVVKVLRGALPLAQFREAIDELYEGDMPQVEGTN